MLLSWPSLLWRCSIFPVAAAALPAAVLAGGAVYNWPDSSSFSLSLAAAALLPGGGVANN